MDVDGHRAHELGIFLASCDSVISGSQFRGAGERLELRRGSVWSKSLPGRTHRPKSVVWNRGRLPRRHHRLVEQKVAVPSV